MPTAATISFGTKFTSGNNSFTNPAVSISTSSACKLIVVGFTISGTSASGFAPTIGTDNFIKAGSTVATSEGNVEMWYMTTNTANRSENVTWRNKDGITHVANISTYNSTAGISFETVGTTFSTSGTLANVTNTLQANTASITVSQYHSGYFTPTGVQNNGSVLYTLDRGSLIACSSYIVGTVETTRNLFWLTPSADDYAMTAASFISDDAPVPGGDLEWNTTAWNAIASINGQSRLIVDTVNTVVT